MPFERGFMEYKGKSLGDLFIDGLETTADFRANAALLGCKYDRHSQETLAKMKESYTHKMAKIKDALDSIVLKANLKAYQ